MRILYIFCLSIFFQIYNDDINNFKKIIIWGHKLHSHTHSYIHWGFFRAFKSLGYNTYWFDDKDDVKNFDFSNSLFITEGQVDNNIPIRNDCFYILHYCFKKKYKPLFDQNRCFQLITYTKNFIIAQENKQNTPYNFSFDDHYFRYDQSKLKFLEHNYLAYDLKANIFFMPWATDLLPYEIEEIKKNISTKKRKNIIYWIGSIGGGTYGNENELNPFIKACNQKNIKFQQFNCNKSTQENIELIQNSYIAPSIQGKWQIDYGYIPCRIFKNISYGQMGVTNSETVYELFNKKIIYNSDTYQLFFDAEKRIKDLKINELFELMDFVKDNHTYINRINSLLKFVNLILEKNKDKK